MTVTFFYKTFDIQVLNIELNSILNLMSKDIFTSAIDIFFFIKVEFKLFEFISYYWFDSFFRYIHRCVNVDDVSISSVKNLENSNKVSMLFMNDNQKKFWNSFNVKVKDRIDLLCQKIV